MNDMFEYIGSINKSSVIVEYVVDNDTIRIKTGDNQDIIIERKDSYINFLNDIISTQNQYKNVERKKYLLKKEKYNRFERIFMYIFLLSAIALVIYFPNVFTSLILLISVISSIVSEITHIHNVMELRKLNSNIGSMEHIVVNEDACINEKIDSDEKLKLIGIDKTLKLLPLPQDEILYLDDEI